MDPRLPPLQAAYAPPAQKPAPAAYGPGAKSVSDASSVRQPPATEPARKAPPVSPPKLSADVRIEVDRAAGRMVQTFLDPATGEELKQFPYEQQLAFSRALMAFERARFPKG